MRFRLIDRIESIEKEGEIRAWKVLTADESYLRDHFPDRAVMPGVMILETMVQAAAWMVRFSTDFRFSVVVLSGVKAIKYGRFISPGDCLRVDVKFLRWGRGEASFQGKVRVGEDTASSARFQMRFLNLAECVPSLKARDDSLRGEMRERFRLLVGDRV